eukprot:TRINITY_DN1170_c0_g1_i3.p1 TRINITY_DN1170_c0_g1~~TRINITY_DN1170_c0_g1_i3.p1  ORF type:complete len:471 (-),score=144.33 TRINITY_DN1170_c0_g1_i3:60-1472(-)
MDSGRSIERVNELYAKAQYEDNQQQYELALHSYVELIQLMMSLASNEFDEEKNMELRLKINQILLRAEEVKRLISASKQTPTPPPPEEEKVLITIHKVKCYLVSNEGKQLELIAGEPDHLKVLQRNQRTLLTIGDKFTYPLTSETPCLSLRTGYYILSATDKCYGIIFPENINERFCTAFEEIVGQYCYFRRVLHPSKVEDPENSEVDGSSVISTITTAATNIFSNPVKQLAMFQESRLSNLLSAENFSYVSEKVDLGGSFVAHGILSTSEMLQKGIVLGGEKLKEHLSPEQIEVNPTVKNTLEIAKEYTPYLAKLSDSLVLGVAKGVGVATSEVLLKKDNESRNKDPIVEGAKEVAGAGVSAFVNVWNALEEAGLTLLNTTGKTATGIIEHKYGSDMGQAFEDGFAVTQNIIKTGIAIEALGPKSIARNIALSTTTAAVKTIFSTQAGKEGNEVVQEGQQLQGGKETDS